MLAILQNQHTRFYLVFKVLILLVMSLIQGCGSIVTQKSNEFITNFKRSVIQSEDVDTVTKGVPAYLLLIDTMIAGSPQDYNTLANGASVYNSYSGLIIYDKPYQQTLTDKSFKYALRAACLKNVQYCNLNKVDFNTFEKIITRMPAENQETLYMLASSWASWIKARSDDWLAIAQLERVRIMMQRLLALNENYADGQVHLYLGVLDTLLPEAMGGRPKSGQKHFLRAIEISKGQNLIAKVYYAKQYARATFNQKLHDSLLYEVLETKTKNQDYNLSNTLARIEANELLRTSEDYF